MGISTQAIVFARPGEVAVIDVEVPGPGPDEVLVRTAFSGVSQGTEPWLLTGKHKGLDPNGSENYPFFPAYQAVGVVERVGEAVTRSKPGDKVAAEGTRLADPALRSDAAGRGSHVGRPVAYERAVVPMHPQGDRSRAVPDRPVSSGMVPRLAGLSARHMLPSQVPDVVAWAITSPDGIRLDRITLRPPAQGTWGGTVDTMRTERNYE